jgi:hypothetical protein
MYSYFAIKNIGPIRNNVYLIVSPENEAIIIDPSYGFQQIKELVKTENDVHQYNWVDSNGDKVFERNHWGMFWIYDCDEYEKLKFVLRKVLSFSYEQFEKELLKYLNNRYSKEFGEERPLIEIGNENCPEIEDY